jgi:hypothetical protein
VSSTTARIYDALAPVLKLPPGQLYLAGVNDGVHRHRPNGHAGGVGYRQTERQRLVHICTVRLHHLFYPGAKVCSSCRAFSRAISVLVQLSADL